MRTGIALLASCVTLLLGQATFAAEELRPGDAAPLFTAKTNTGAIFDLASRKGQWTVLYFYPKAGTPGCTKEAQAFRDTITSIRDIGAEVYGISTDTVESQAAFSEENHLGFTLLADPEGTVVKAYGAKMPILTIARRWTFIIGPDLKIQEIQRDVDPALDAQRVAAAIMRLKSAAPPDAQP